MTSKFNTKTVVILVVMLALSLSGVAVADQVELLDKASAFLAQLTEMLLD